MKRRLPALVLALILLTGLAAVCAQASGLTGDTVMYVYTDNGKGLNVRSAPYVGNNIIGLAKFGSRLTIVRFLDSGWACINWPNYGEAYVQSRYLQWYAPAGYATPTPVPTAVPTPVPYLSNNTNTYNGYTGYSSGSTGYSYADSLATLNAEFRTARIVSPFTISVRPTRASGWVNMRWAPSKDTEVISTYRTGAQLTVIAETQSWYQVMDTNTNATGFMMKPYTIRQW